MQHSVSTLRYRLLEGPVCLEPLVVLATRQAVWGEWQVTLSVLGASHAVRLTRPGVCLTELLACAAPEGALRVLGERAGDTPGKLCVPVSGLLCRVTLEPFSLTEGVGLQGGFPAERQLSFAYPTPVSGETADERLRPEGPTPLTRLGWRTEESALTIETIHTYPEEGRGVRSVTVWTPEGEQG